MTGTMTWVGLGVHGRSTNAAAIDTMTDELRREKFGPGLDAPVAWLLEQPGPVRACYEAGPTGYGLYRKAVRAGIGMQIIAPGKTPRGPSDRVKTDRKDAELLARLLLAGGLTLAVFNDLLHSLDGLSQRKTQIALQLSELATDERWWPTVDRRRCFRGIDTLTAFSLHLELGGDWQRIELGPALSAWLSLTPSLSQSGESSRSGGITKTGLTLARRLPVECAWHPQTRRRRTTAAPPRRPALRRSSRLPATPSIA
jgi:transposase